VALDEILNLASLFKKPRCVRFTFSLVARHHALVCPTILPFSVGRERTGTPQVGPEENWAFSSSTSPLTSRSFGVAESVDDWRGK
jgi:hypothetical protein